MIYVMDCYGVSFVDPFCYLCLSLIYCLVCFLQQCDHLLGRAVLLALLCDVFLCFCHFPIRCGT